MPTPLSSRPCDPLQLAMELMAIDSTSGSEHSIVNHVHGILSGRGWKVERVPVTAGRDDILATCCDSPALTLSTHLDTVAPYFPPRMDGDLLRGRGACDAKGIAAAMICAAERLRSSGFPVALLLLVGEETTHDGARAANQVANSSRVLIAGEPTESTLALGSKGFLRVTVRTRGVAAHSAYPELGRSAIEALVNLLHRLPSLELPVDPTLGNTTVNVGQIGGGIADNVVAAEAWARLMVRVVTSPELVQEQLQAWAAGQAELEWGASTPPVHLAALPGFPTSVVSYATDIPQLTNWGRPYLYGPGSIQVAHGDSESIRVAELFSAVEEYERLARAALAAR